MNRLTLLVLLVGAALAGVLKTNAQPVTTLYSFVRGPINPHAGLALGNDGNFYGTTAGGGRNLSGTLFRLTTNGVLTTLYSFAGYPDGSGPTADLTLGPDGNFYGTTRAGGTTLTGANDTGVVFKMNTNGIPATLVNFNGTNGGHPDAALTLGPDGDYYGTTEFSGSNNVGTVFKVTTNGTLTTLVTFNTTNGANPVSCLTLAPGGTFYGTTEKGGKFGLGTAFKLTTNGDFTMLNNFDQTNGAWPAGRMALGPDGNLYGTTAYIGTAFEMTTNGVVTTLYNFDTSNNSTNGLFPYSGLTLGPDGNFYGTTSQGGTNGSGTIFQVSTNGTLAMLARMPGVQVQYITNSMGVIYYTTNNFATVAPFLNGSFTPLYSFSALVNSDNADGADPESDLTLGPDGNFYGTTVGGGTNGAGAVFKISTNGTFTALASCAGNVGYNPYAGVTAGPGASLYGVVKSGGTTGYGTAYKVSAAGQFTLLHNFSYFPDGANPQAALIQGPDGNFYGTAVGGGTNLLQTGPGSYQAESFGTVFELATNGTFTPLAYFNGTNGANPYGGLAFGPDGNLYGTTAYGGLSNNGVVFRLLTNGTMTALANFTGANGANPYGGLTLGLDGNFYGTCEAGGANGNGTVFQVTTNGALMTLAYFDGTNGANPNAGVTLGPDGSFYGTAYGGDFGHRGTVFKITTGGALTTLVNFAQTNGSGPVAGLALGPDGNFYGTTSLGGVNNFQGTLFKLTADGTLTTLYSFAIPNGSAPFATLTLQTNRHFINFYGTSFGDGSDHPGTVFRVNLTSSYTIAENTTETFSPLTNEVVWATGGVLGLLTAVATNGTAHLSGSGIGFTPATNFTGTATISYTVTDNAGGTNASFITILVTNVPPVANPDFYAVAENSSANVLDPLANDSVGTTGGVLSLVSVSPTNGTAVISGAHVLFTPAANVTGTATIGYTVTDGVGGTNSSLITVTITSARADLSLSAGAAPAPVSVGSNLVYSLTVSNAGPSTATGVVVSNQLPANVLFVSATGGATPLGGVLLVNLGALAAGAADSVQMVLQPTSAGQLTNLFQVFANEPDPVPTNNVALVTSTVTQTVAGGADLSLGVTVGPNPLDVALTNLTYTIIVSNAGPATAADVTVSSEIFTTNSGIVFGSATGGSTPTNGILEINLGPLAPGETNQAQITAYVVRPAVPPASFYTNTFEVFGDQNDPDPGNNFATVTFEATNANATLFTTSTRASTNDLTANSSQQTTNFTTQLIAVMPGGMVVYSQTFAAPFSDAAIQAAIGQAALDLTSAGATSYIGPAETSSLQDLQDTLSVTVTNPIGTNITAVVTEYTGPTNIFVGPNQSEPLDLLSGQNDFDTLVTSEVTNLATTTTTSIYTNSAVYMMTGIVAQATEDLSLTASGAPEPVGEGSNLVYSLIVSNTSAAQPALKHGPHLVLSASNVTISNRIPAGVTFVSATGGAGPTNGLLLINLGSLAEGATTFAQVIVQPSSAGKITNTFVVFADQADPVPTNNVATVISTVTNPPPATVDVVLSLVAAPSPVDVGSPLTYLLTVTNNSATTATGVIVSNTLPVGVTLNSVLPGSGIVATNGEVLTISLGTLPNGTADSIAIVIIPNAPGLLTNRATAYSAQTDSAPTNNGATNITTAVAVPITNLVLTVLPGITLNPQTGLYEEQVLVSNGGPLTPGAVLVLISGLGGNTTLYNATGITNGTPYVQSPGPLGVGSNVVFLLEYYVPARVTPDPTLTVQPGPPVNPPVITGAVMSISRTVGLPNGSILVEFDAIPGRIYAVQYSSDLVTWKTAVPVITAPANRVQWIDAGPPHTASSPTQAGSRYYRVILLP